MSLKTKWKYFIAENCLKNRNMEIKIQYKSVYIL